MPPLLKIIGVATCNRKQPLNAGRPIIECRSLQLPEHLEQHRRRRLANASHRGVGQPHARGGDGQPPHLRLAPTHRCAVPVPPGVELERRCRAACGGGPSRRQRQKTVLSNGRQGANVLDVGALPAGGTFEVSLVSVLAARQERGAGPTAGAANYPARRWPPAGFGLPSRTADWSTKLAPAPETQRKGCHSLRIGKSDRRRWPPCRCCQGRTPAGTTTAPSLSTPGWRRGTCRTPPGRRSRTTRPSGCSSDWPTPRRSRRRLRRQFAGSRRCGGRRRHTNS